MADDVSATVPINLEGWGSLSVEALADLLETSTRRLQVALEQVALDEAAYHRKFWTVWQTLTPQMSIAAMNRECEHQAKEYQAELILKRSLAEAHRVRVESLRAVLGSRS